MARIKTVYETVMVCHLWANRHAHDVRNSSGNVFTRGASLYSYGSHFIIGTFLDKPAPGGSPLLLFTHDRYGATTGNHVDAAWRALSKSQRDMVTHVPRMRADDVREPEGLAGLAKSCIELASEKLEKSGKARDSRPFLIGEARRFMESARSLYLYIGDKKSAQGVPVIGQDADKPAVVAILASIKGAEYLQAARQTYEKAKKFYSEHLAMAGSYRHAIEHDPSLLHGLKDYGVNARRVWCLAMGADKNCEFSIHAYKQAGANVPPVVTQLQSKARKAAKEWEGLADAEQLEETRRDILDNVRRMWPEVRRARQSGGVSKSLGFYSNRIDVPRDAAQWVALFPDEPGTREATKAFCDRVSRMLFGSSVLSALRDIENDNRHYVDMVQSGKECTPDSPSRLASYARKWADKMGRIMPQTLATRVQLAMNTAIENERKHAQDMQAREAEKIAAWRAGENVRLAHGLPVMIRIQGDNVHTSRGAVVPLEHAARLARIAQRVARAGGATYDAGQGPIVGHFRVNSIGADMSTVIGCHDIGADESARAIALIEGEMQSRGQSLPAESTNS